MLSDQLLFSLFLLQLQLLPVSYSDCSLASVFNLNLHQCPQNTEHCGGRAKKNTGSTNPWRRTNPSPELGPPGPLRGIFTSVTATRCALRGGVFLRLSVCRTATEPYLWLKSWCCWFPPTEPVFLVVCEPIGSRT